MARVLLIGTFETKRQELAYFSTALRSHGLEVELLDVSLGISRGGVVGGREADADGRKGGGGIRPYRHQLSGLSGRSRRWGWDRG